MKTIFNLFTQKDKLLHILAGAIICYAANLLGNLINFGLQDLRPYELFALAVSAGAIIGYGFDYYFQPVFSGRNSKHWFWVLLDELGIVPQGFKTTPDKWDVIATVIGFAIGIIIFIFTVDYQNM